MGSSETFGYTGTITTFTATEAGVYDITAYGAQGGTGANGDAGGKGAEIGGTFTLTAGEQIEIIVGGAGANSVKGEPGGGGGGGGGSFVIETFNGTVSVHDPLLIAGGGGGGSYGGGSEFGEGYNGGIGRKSSSGGAGTDDGGTGGAGGSGGKGGYGGTNHYGAGGGGGYSGGGGVGSNQAGQAGSGPGFGYAGGIAGSNTLNGDTIAGGAGGYGGGGGGGINAGGGGGGYGGGGGGGGLINQTSLRSTELGGGGGGGSLDNAGSSIVEVAGVQSGSGEVVIQEICYLRGTSILTPFGSVPVQDLRIGDLVVTRFSGMQPVKWIGRQSFDRRFMSPLKFPVCIRAGALGNGMPVRDLYISPGHSVLLDGVLVLARYLVNGLTITQDWAPPQIDYFNIELAAHDCLVAEGAWAETYADVEGLRNQFHNAAEYAALYPADPPPEDMFLCAPRPERGTALATPLRPIAALAGSGLRPGSLHGYVDGADLPWKIRGWAQDSTYPQLPVLLDILLDGAVLGSALACDFREDLKAAGIGQGRCAFNFTAPCRIAPEQMEKLQIRRAVDGAVLPLAASLQDEIAAFPESAAASEPILRAVA